MRRAGRYPNLICYKSLIVHGWQRAKRDLEIVMRRSGKDRRARLAVTQLLIFTVYVLLMLAIPYLLTSSREPSSVQQANRVALYAVMFLVICFGAWLRRRSNQASPLRLSQYEVAPVIVSYFVERTQILTAIVMRGFGEIGSSAGLLEAVASESARPIPNMLLRERHLWEKLEPVERELLSAPNRTWSEEQQNQVGTWLEQLRLLRWALGFDEDLTLLAHFPEPAAIGLDAFEKNAAEQLRSSGDIRVERDLAADYFLRVVAELHHRGLLEESPDLVDWSGQLRENVAGPSTDLLAGSRTVGELDAEALRTFGGIVFMRWRYAGYLVDQWMAEMPISFAEWELTQSFDEG